MKNVELLKKYEKQNKISLFMVILFTITSVFFSLIGICTHKYDVFWGVALQLVAVSIQLYEYIDTLKEIRKLNDLECDGF